MIKVFYHANCPDGFCSAYVMWLEHKENAEYFPLNYGEDFPAVDKEDHIYFVDFSSKRDRLIELASKVKSITIIDHHKTAQEDLVDLPDNIELVFDMSKSGAMLTWEYVFPTMAAPDIVSYVQDRDLWKFELPHSRAINAAISAYPKDFKAWDTNIFASGIDMLKVQGYTLLMMQTEQIKSAVSQAAPLTLPMGDKSITFPAANSCLYFSEIANELVKQGNPIGGCYYRLASGEWKFSLRSDGKADASEIAKHFGGGGHKSASGFTLAHKTLFA